MQAWLCLALRCQSHTGSFRASCLAMGPALLAQPGRQAPRTGRLSKLECFLIDCLRSDGSSTCKDKDLSYRCAASAVKSSLMWPSWEYMSPALTALRQRGGRGRATCSTSLVSICRKLTRSAFSPCVRPSACILGERLGLAIPPRSYKSITASSVAKDPSCM